MKRGSLARIHIFVFAVLATFAAKHGHANVPNERYRIVKATVYDVKTELTWEQDESAKLYIWSDAWGHCDNLVLADYDDWRVPSVKELQTLVDITGVTPTLAIDSFPNADPVRYWTSSPVTVNTSTAWAIDFATALTATPSKTEPYRVRCVRSTK